MTLFLKKLGEAPLSAWFGIVIVTLIALIAIFAPVLAPYPEFEVVGPQYSP